MINTSEKDIGLRIKEMRKEKGYSQEEMSEKCNCIRQTYAKWEKGIGITLDTLVRLCKIFECDPGYLLGEYNTKQHITADIQEQTGLSEKAIINFRSMIAESIAPVRVLDSMLTQNDFRTLLHKIYDMAQEKSAYTILKKKRQVAVRSKKEKEIAAADIAIPIIENRRDSKEYKVSVVFNQLLSKVVEDLSCSDDYVQGRGTAIVENVLDETIRPYISY